MRQAKKRDTDVTAGAWSTSGFAIDFTKSSGFAFGGSLRGSLPASQTAASRWPSRRSMAITVPEAAPSSASRSGAGDRGRAFVLLLALRPPWTARLSIVGVAGRMALTNYMLQVATLDWLSSDYGAALHVRPVVSVACSLLLFGALAGFSRAWLGRFRFGPAEWIWRCFTYLRWQPLRHPRSPPPLGAAAGSLP